MILKSIRLRPDRPFHATEGWRKISLQNSILTYEYDPKAPRTRVWAVRTRDTWAFAKCEVSPLMRARFMLQDMGDGVWVN